MSGLEQYRGFAIALVPAALGGAIWSSFGLPLAWLMGAAIVTGLMCFSGLTVVLPKLQRGECLPRVFQNFLYRTLQKHEIMSYL